MAADFLSFFFFFLAMTQFVGSCFWDQGLNPGPQQWVLVVPTTGPPGIISSYPVLLSSFKPSRRQWDTVSTSKISSSHLLGASQVTQVKNPLANAEDLRDLGSIPGWENPLEKEMATHSSISCLGNPTDRGTWQATVHMVTQSRTQLKWHSTCHLLSW